VSAQPDLGERLRALRRDRGLSLAKVARGTDISQSFLSLVETGQTDITIGRLIRLVAFYGLHVSDLLPPSPSSDAIVVRKDEEQHLSSPGEGIDVYLLTSDTSSRTMMPIVAIFEPEGGLAEYAEHEGEEFVHVLKGSIEAEIDGHEPITLRKNDNVHFRANRRHSYRNPGKSRAIVLAVVTPPTL
jgi:transcriptional regulator with XRE-family HTH domain